MAENLAAPAATTLAHVNVPPAQTWNYLHTNECSFEVPAVAKNGNVFDPQPSVFLNIECPLGEDALAWIRKAAAEPRFVNVRAGSEEPVVIEVSPTGEAVADTCVYVREGANATIVMCTSGASETAERATCASLLRVIADRDAHVRIVELVAADDTVQHLEGVGIRAGRGAKVEVSQFFVGGAKVACGLGADLAGDRADFDLSCRYYAEGKEELDITHTVRARGRKTTEDMVVSGMLAGDAKKALRETIDLIHGSAGSVGNEAETVLVTGDGVVNKTLPVILCDEDDVQGNHGATIGSISPDQLAYLADRGLSETEVEQLFARAIFDDALFNVAEFGLAGAVTARAAQVLGPEAAKDMADGLDTNAAREE